MLKESSTSRIYSHITDSKNGWVIVSPYRYTYTLQQNRGRMLKLKSQVRDMGYGFTQLISRWVEFDPNEGKNVSSDEEALLIIGMPESVGFELASQYEQSSFIVGQPKSDGGKCYEICTTPFELEDDNGEMIKSYKTGDVVRTFNVSNSDTPLNIADAEAIFKGKIAGPSSKPIKSNRPFRLKEVLIVEAPQASYFQTRRKLYKLYENTDDSSDSEVVTTADTADTNWFDEPIQHNTLNDRIFDLETSQPYPDVIEQIPARR